MIKLKNNTLVIDLAEKQIILKRVVRKNLTNFLNIYSEVLEEVIRLNFGVGEYLSDDKNYNKLKKLLALFPVEGQDTGFNIEEVEEEHDLLIQLLIASNWDVDKKELESGGQLVDRPYFARFLALDFDTRIQDISVKLSEEKGKKALEYAKQKMALEEMQKNLLT
jgi:hypothetical protein